MKTNILLLTGFFLIALSPLAKAQDQDIDYLFNTDEYTISAFGSYMTEYSILDGDFAYSTGGGAALSFNQKFYIGGYGQGTSFNRDKDLLKIKNPLTNELKSYTNLDREFGHGGLWIGYVHNHSKSIHFGISTKIGGGRVKLTDEDFINEGFGEVVKDRVFVLTPQLEMEVNLLKWAKAQLGVGYRYVAGTNKSYLTEVNGSEQMHKYFNDRDLSSPQISLSILIGGFNY